MIVTPRTLLPYGRGLAGLVDGVGRLRGLFGAVRRADPPAFAFRPPAVPFPAGGEEQIVGHLRYRPAGLRVETMQAGQRSFHFWSRYNQSQPSS